MKRRRPTLLLILPAVAVGLLTITAWQAVVPAAGGFPPFQSPPVNDRNHLGSEHNPYLLEHARDLVNWYAWGAEPFERAEREHKLIFLSIGYSACHWCHVMQ